MFLCFEMALIGLFNLKNATTTMLLNLTKIPLLLIWVWGLINFAYQITCYIIRFRHEQAVIDQPR
jgi:hypothetical protein